MKQWLDQCQANGGGDTPEAVANAPPHGLDESGDKFPKGCLVGHDPGRIIRDMAEQRITLYSVGVEPPIGNEFLLSVP